MRRFWLGQEGGRHLGGGLSTKHTCFVEGGDWPRAIPYCVSVDLLPFKGAAESTPHTLTATLSRSGLATRFHLQTLMIYEHGFNQNYYNFTMISLIKIVLRSRFLESKCMKHKGFDMQLVFTFGWRED